MEHLAVQSWSGVFPFAQCGEEYYVPIPKAPIFGERSINVTVGNSGALTKIGYTNNTAVDEVLGIGNQITGNFGGVANARERLSDLKLRADLIAAQQRLAKCIAEPESCK